MKQVHVFLASIIGGLLLSQPSGTSSATTCIEQQTGDDGKFSFDQLKAGNYEIQVRIEAVRVSATHVVLVHPEVKPKREIAVSMIPNGCSGFSLVNSKQFEELNPK